MPTRKENANAPVGNAAFRHLALCLALAIFFLHTVGETLHDRLHCPVVARIGNVRTLNSDAEDEAQIGASSLTSHEHCPFCSLGHSTAVMVGTVDFATVPILYVAPSGVFLVRDTPTTNAPLRAGSRAPPAFV